MSYIVLYTLPAYRSTDMYKAWLKCSDMLGFERFLREKYNHIFDYVDDISEDYLISGHMLMDQNVVGWHDYKALFYRVRKFTFHSEAHYAWFVLRYT